MNVYFSKNVTRDDIPAIIAGEHFLVITLKEIHPKMQEALAASNVQSIGSCPEEAYNDLRDILSMADFTSQSEILQVCKDTIRDVKALTLRD